MLVDGGASVNLMPYTTFRKLGKGPKDLMETDMIMGTGIPIFRQVEVTIVVTENDTPIRLQIERSNHAILAPQLLWLSTKTQI